MNCSLKEKRRRREKKLNERKDSIRRWRSKEVDEKGFLFFCPKSILLDRARHRRQRMHSSNSCADVKVYWLIRRGAGGYRKLCPGETNADHLFHTFRRKKGCLTHSTVQVWSRGIDLYPPYSSPYILFFLSLCKKGRKEKWSLTCWHAQVAHLFIPLDIFFSVCVLSSLPPYSPSLVNSCHRVECPTMLWWCVQYSSTHTHACLLPLLSIQQKKMGRAKYDNNRPFRSYPHLLKVLKNVKLCNTFELKEELWFLPPLLRLNDITIGGNRVPPKKSKSTISHFSRSFENGRLLVF